MIYLDYAATTPPSELSLTTLASAARRYFANPNSAHAAGRDALAAMDEAASSIRHALSAEAFEVVFTAGASEANNLAIKGYAVRHRRPDARLLTTPFEHSSVIAPIAHLADRGFLADVVEIGADGRVDLRRFAERLEPETILVSVAAVQSELGIVQPLAAIAAAVARHGRAVLHVDATQAIGKIPLSLEGIHLASLSAHKFYGPKGVGALLRRPDVDLEPLIHGGHSTTAVRSGTPAAPLALALAASLQAAVGDQTRNAACVRGLNDRLRHNLASLPDVVFNSPSDAVPHILNLSLLTRDAADTVARLDARGFCVSRQTACSTKTSRSEAVFRLTGDERRARTSFRVSLSHLTTTAEIDAFAAALAEEAIR